jgi:choline kinase
MQGATIVILDILDVEARDPAAAARPRRALDWVLHAFDTARGAELYFITGGPREAVARRYPELSVLMDPRWEGTGSVGSLFVAPLRADRECYVTRSDLVVRSRLIDRLAAAGGDVAIAVTGRAGAAARVVIDDRGQAVAAGAGTGGREAGAALVGIARLSPRAVECLLALRDLDDGRLAKAPMAELLRELVARGLEVRAVADEGDWARLDGPQDLARFVLGTKAESLERLRPLVTRCTIGRQVRCSVAEWRAAPQAVLGQVAAVFGARPLAVRSSASSEDDWGASRAGHFTSVVDVAPDRAAVSRAIDAVIASYGEDPDDQQVLIQEMIDSVQLSGVVFTRTLTRGMPYYTINYDDTSCHTGDVTSGTGKDLRTVVIHRGAAAAGAPAQDPRLLPVMRAVLELEELVGHDALDIEFALGGAGEVHVLQLRPIAVARSDLELADEALDRELGSADEALERARKRGPGLVGWRSYFGIMPDWNPAEIIGTSPRRLALSLYRRLITDEVWAIQRAECGYRDVRPNPLLVTLAGHPYIDIRASFNSFVPASLHDGLAERLVDHYLQRLRRYPYLHDKVEFEVAFTCLTFDFDQRAQGQLRTSGFTPAEIDQLEAGLRCVTQEIMRRYPEDLRSLERLEERYDALMQRRLEPRARASALLEDCRRHGTLPFAHLARGAFVAVALLRSMTAVGLLDPEQQAAFLSSLSTVSRGFERDGGHVAAGRLSWEAFVRRYRHLRPGTYEITSPSYGDEPERYLRPATLGGPAAGAAGRSVSSAAGRPAAGGAARSVWSAATRQAIGDRLSMLGLPASVPELERFLRATIEGRERSKFIFTRHLSQALDDLAAFALQHGCTREQLSHMDIQDLLQIDNGMSSGEIAAFIAARASEGQRAHHVALCTQLPSLVFDRRDLRVFERFRSQPNFVTSKRVVAPLVELSGTSEIESGGSAIGGRLVLVPRADPGYDWLFGHPLAGLITMYGGANSHLAIRAAEANLPAAIGVGESCYERLARARVLEMDCAGQQIRPVQ